MNKLNALLAVNNQTTLLTLLGVLIAFVVLLTILGIVFIIALRKRRPIVKVIMSPDAQQNVEASTETAATTAIEVQTAEMPAVRAENTAAQPVEVIDKQAIEGYLVPVYIITAYENVYYSFSPYEISSQPHEKYSAIKNNIQSYERVKERTSNTREGYRVGRASSSGVKRNHVKQSKGFKIATAKRKIV